MSCSSVLGTGSIAGLSRNQDASASRGSAGLSRGKVPADRPPVHRVNADVPESLAFAKAIVLGQPREVGSHPNLRRPGASACRRAPRAPRTTAGAAPTTARGSTWGGRAVRRARRGRAPSASRRGRPRWPAACRAGRTRRTDEQGERRSLVALLALRRLVLLPGHELCSREQRPLRLLNVVRDGVDPHAGRNGHRAPVPVALVDQKPPRPRPRPAGPGRRPTPPSRGPPRPRRRGQGGRAAPAEPREGPP